MFAGPERRQRVFLVDDDELSSFRLGKTLGDMGFDVVQAWGAEQAVSMFRNLFHVIDVVLLNVDMAGQDALVAFEWMKNIDPNVRVLLLTEALHRDSRVEAAIDRGAIGAMSKGAGGIRLAVGIDTLSTAGVAEGLRRA
jgi:DNA-binding NtrC family response regulator